MDRLVARSRAGFTQFKAKMRGRGLRFLAWKAYDRARKRAWAAVPTSARRTAARLGVRLAFRGRGPLDQHLLSRRLPRFLVEQDDVDPILAACLERIDDYEKDLLGRADAICANTIPILSAGPVDLGGTIDWHRDYVTGLGWPRQPAHRIDLFDAGRPTDVRTVWELNRLHFLTALGKAYRVTGDSRYAEKVVELVRSWDESNPVGVGVNWTCAMEAALRIVNLWWGLFLVLPSAEADEAFARRVVEMLVEHGSFVRHNLEWGDVRNNHYLADAGGLLWLGALLPEVPAARRWQARLLPRFEAEIDHQTHADGASHEGSIPYHRLVLELFLTTTVLLRRNGIQVRHEVPDRMARMAGLVAGYLRPDGTCPMFGDTDDGRMHVLGSQDVNDHRFVLAIAGGALQRPDLSGAAGGFWEEAAWVLGPRYLEAAGAAARRAQPTVPSAARPPVASPVASAGFPDGGWFFLRGGGSYVAVDCGDVGARGRGGHGHCDLLSLEAAFQGVPIVVDTGNSRYTSDRDERSRCLGAAAHNAVLVDGMEYAAIYPFGVGWVVAPPGRLLRWEAGPDTTVFEGEHSGYRHLGITHRRRIETSASSSEVRVLDVLDGAGDHLLAARFHLAPDCAVTIAGRTCELVHVPTGTQVGITAEGTDAGSWQAEPCTIYPSYGRGVLSTRIDWTRQATLPATLRFTLR